MRRRSLMGGEDNSYDAIVDYIHVNDSCLKLDYGVDATQDEIIMFYQLVNKTNQARIMSGPSANLYINGSGMYAYHSDSDTWNNTTVLVPTYLHKGYWNFATKAMYADETKAVNGLSGMNRNRSTGTDRKFYFFTSFDNDSHPIFDANIYRIEIYRGGNLLYCLIPVRKGSKGFFYDKVEQKLYKPYNPSKDGWGQVCKGVFEPSQDTDLVQTDKSYIDYKLYITNEELYKYRFEYRADNCHCGWVNNSKYNNTSLWLGVASAYLWFGNFTKKSRSFAQGIQANVDIDCYNGTYSLNGETGTFAFSQGDSDISNVPFIIGRYYDYVDNLYRHSYIKGFNHFKVYKEGSLILDFEQCGDSHRVIEAVSGQYYPLKTTTSWDPVSDI